MKGVLGIGNALTDLIALLPDDKVLNILSFPKGSMQLVDIGFSDKVLELIKDIPKTLCSGGSAANTIRALAHLDVKASFLGKTGYDDFGVAFENEMQKCGILPYLLKSKSPSGRAVTLVTPDSERTFATYLGAATELAGTDIKKDYFCNSGYVHIEGYLLQNHDLVIKIAETAKEAGVKLSYDMASYNVVENNLAFLKEFLKKYTHIVFANEEEAKAYTGKTNLEALEVLAGETDIAIIKIGSEGSIIRKGNEIHKINAIKANCTDTTGAGDLYAAGFLYGQVMDLGLKKSGELGALLAGKVVETVGSKLSEDVWNIIYHEIRNIVYNNEHTDEKS